MKTFMELLAVIDQVDFPGLTFWVGHEGASLRVECPEGSPYGSPEMPTWSGRWWRLSPHMTDGEIVQTCWLAVMTALEHEARERFTYKAVSVFDPHFDIDRLVDLRLDPQCLLGRNAPPPADP